MRFLLKNIFLKIKRRRPNYAKNVIGTYLNDVLTPIRYTPSDNDEIILEYGVELANIRIIRKNDEIIYTVDEPVIPENVKEYLIGFLQKYIETVDADIDVTDNLFEQILIEVEEKYNDTGIDFSEFYYVINYYLNKLMSGYGILYPLINDDYIEEISCEAPNIPIAVYHSMLSEYRWINTNIVLNNSALDNFVLLLSKKIGKYLSAAFPYAEGLTEEGHRVAITLGKEVSFRGSSFVIRRRPSRILTITDLIKNNTISLLETTYLMYVLEYNPFIIITGSVATGKTTLLRALLTLLPDSIKIITIEDTPELQLPHTHWDPLVTRKTLGGLFNTKIDMYDLAKFALRRRGDYLIIGEVRGEEARILAQASVLGYGVLTTFHADSAKAALTRLTLPPISLDEKIRTHIWSIIHLRRVFRQGQGYIRRVYEIVEPSEKHFNRVFEWNEKMDNHNPKDINSLIEKSIVLNKIMEYKNMDAKELKKDIILRMNFLKQLIDKNVNTQDEILLHVTKFYNKVVNHHS